MTIFSISPLIVAILFFVSGVLVYLKDKKSAVNIVLALEWAALVLWLFGYFMAYSTKQEDVAIFWVKLAYIGVIFIPTLFYHFTMVFLQIGPKKIKRKIYTAYAGALAFLGFLYFSPYMVSGVNKFFWGYQTKVGPVHNLYMVYFAALLIASFLNFYTMYKKVRNKLAMESVRIKYVFLAFGIGSLGAIDFIANYGVEFYPFGFIFIGMGLMILNYAIIRYQVMNINVAITRAGIFAIVYTLVLGIPFGVGAFIKEPLSKAAPHWWWLLPMFLLVVSASIAPFVYIRLQKRIESRLRYQEFESHKALRKLSHNMLRFTNLEGLLKLIVHHLVKILNLKFAAVYLLDSQANKYILKSYWRPQQSLDTSFEPPAEFSRNSSLAKDLYIRRLPIVTEELRLFAPNRASSHIRELISILLKLKSNIVIPSFLRNDVLGFLVLSDRRTNTAFTQEDLNLLMVLSNEAALAIENAQFHQKEKMVLMEKSRREALADMAPGASHQFNNRLVSISSSAELMLLKLEKIKTKKLKDEEVKTVLKEAKETLELIDKEVYKGKEITSAILRRAKAKVDFQKVDIKSLIENAHKLVQIGHSGSGIQKFKEPKFKMKLLTDVRDIFASEALLQDCFYNLIDNAFDAIRDAISKKVKPETHAGEIIVTLQQKDQIFTIQVSDNGIGLTKENQRKLFTPYFTTKATSGKGSGLGLYVIRDFIEMHKGTVGCDSEYGKGTTFTVKIPIKNNHGTAKK